MWVMNGGLLDGQTLSKHGYESWTKSLLNPLVDLLSHPPQPVLVLFYTEVINIQTNGPTDRPKHGQTLLLRWEDALKRMKKVKKRRR